MKQNQMGCLALGSGLAREEEGQLSHTVRLGCGPQEVHREGAQSSRQGGDKVPWTLLEMESHCLPSGFVGKRKETGLPAACW